MLEEEIAKNIVESRKPEEVLDAVVEVLSAAQSLLRPGADPKNIEFTAGMVSQQIAEANKVLRAFRQVKYGQKPISVL